jgi:hypothetical protein
MKRCLNRWQRLVWANRGRWLTSFEQLMAISSTTISKVRSEAKANGVRWITRERIKGLIEYKPVTGGTK